MVWDHTNSFTGETTASALSEIGCKYVIIGHSERRLYLEETEAMIGQMAATAISHLLTPVLCVGETFDRHRTGRSQQVILEQLTVLFSAATDEPRSFVVAYEPAWAIGTGSEALECKPGEAGDRHGFICDALTRELGSANSVTTTILYGGNVTATNVASHPAESDMDGAWLARRAKTRPRSGRWLMLQQRHTSASQARTDDARSASRPGVAPARKPEAIASLPPGRQLSSADPSRRARSRGMKRTPRPWSTATVAEVRDRMPWS